MDDSQHPTADPADHTNDADAGTSGTTACAPSQASGSSQPSTERRIVRVRIGPNSWIAEDASSRQLTGNYSTKAIRTLSCPRTHGNSRIHRGDPAFESTLQTWLRGEIPYCDVCHFEATRSSAQTFVRDIDFGPMNQQHGGFSLHDGTEDQGAAALLLGLSGERQPRGQPEFVRNSMEHSLQRDTYADAAARGDQIGFETAHDGRGNLLWRADPNDAWHYY